MISYIQPGKILFLNMVASRRNVLSIFHLRKGRCCGGNYLYAALAPPLSIQSSRSGTPSSREASRRSPVNRARSSNPKSMGIFVPLRACLCRGRRWATGFRRSAGKWACRRAKWGRLGDSWHRSSFSARLRTRCYPRRRQLCSIPGCAPCLI